MRRNEIFFCTFTGILTGGAVFIYFFGIAPLNIYNINWYVNLGGDSAQHVTGWIAYLHSEWSFPIGLQDKLVYPEKYSIIYTDSIPLLAVIFKLFSFLYGGENVQYFGLYGLINFILQSIFASFIVRYFTKNKLVIVLFSLMFLFMPVLWQRLFGHHSLSSHWIILLTISYILYNYKKDNLKKDTIFWVLLTSFTTTIHMYFLPMTYMLLFYYAVYKSIKYKRYKYLLILLYSLIVVVFVLFIMGAFYNLERTNTGEDLLYYGYNLTGMFNSDGTGSILPKLPKATVTSEGYAYLGFGNIIIVTLALLMIFYSFIINFKSNYIGQNISLKKYLYENIESIFVVLILITFTIVAGGGYLSFNKSYFHLININNSMIFSPFRASGRFSWIIIYILMAIAVFKFSSMAGSKKKELILIILLFSILLLQIYDLKGFFNSKKYTVENSLKMETKTYLSENDCNYLKSNSIEYILTPTAKIDDIPIIFNILKCNLAVTNFYFARQPVKMISKNNHVMYNDFINNKNSNDILIAHRNNFRNSSIVEMNSKEIGNYLIFSRQNIPFGTNIDLNMYTGKDIMSFQFISNGVRNNNSVILNNGGVIFGPYNIMEKGLYKVTVKGENIGKKNLIIDTWSNVEFKKYSIEYKEKNDNSLVLKLNLEETVFAFEFRIYNFSETVKVDSVEIEKYAEKI